MVGAGGGQWSLVMWSVVGGRCFAFLLVGGRFLFLRMVGSRCLNQYMVGGRWLMVDGLWSVAGRWAVVLYYAWSRHWLNPSVRLKFSGGGRGGDTFKTPSPLRTTFAFTHPLF